MTRLPVYYYNSFKVLEIESTLVYVYYDTCTSATISLIASQTAADVISFSVSTQGIEVTLIFVRRGTFVYVYKKTKTLTSLNRHILRRELERSSL